MSRESEHLGDEDRAPATGLGAGAPGGEALGGEANCGLHVYLILGGGLLAISVSAILIRIASSAPGEALAVWRTIFAAALLAPFALARAREEIMSLTRREVVLIVVSGAFLGFHFITWISSLYYTNVASASTLVSLSPIFLAVLGFSILKERPRNIEIAAILVATLGTVVLGWVDQNAENQFQGSNPLLGNGLALSAAGFVSVYILIGRHIRQKRSWLAYVAPLYFVTALTTVAVALFRGVELFGYDWSIYALCLSMAVFPQLMGHGALNYALRFFPAATIGLASLFEPVGASLLAFGFFGEVPTLIAAVAMIVILVSVGLAMRPAPGNAQ